MNEPIYEELDDTHQKWISRSDLMHFSKKEILDELDLSHRMTKDSIEERFKHRSMEDRAVSFNAPKIKLIEGDVWIIFTLWLEEEVFEAYQIKLIDLLTRGTEYHESREEWDAIQSLLPKIQSEMTNLVNQPNQ